LKHLNPFISANTLILCMQQCFHGRGCQSHAQKASTAIISKHFNQQPGSWRPLL